MIEGLKCIIKGSELKVVIDAKIGWNSNELLEASQRKIKIASGGNTEALELQLERDTRQLKFLRDHVKDDEEYCLNMQEVSALGIGLDTSKDKPSILKLN